ncbi:hypothetical protein [Caulobacter sp. BK020]|uniref:hypothetical protein n=1 Tax=Caulobacter sp. BK020 TaxID=2512117 RepID=UPI001052F6A6|nr:hypothetical protein [Caulobacter sp. BK020]TCS10323.1 hypothetical protein EV278_11861 [Caulobacter sp. BK020]
MNNVFELAEGVGHRGGLSVEIGTGPRVPGAQTGCLYIHDDAFSFIDPLLTKHAANYRPGARYGVTEVAADAWRAVAGDLRALAERLATGVSPGDADISWIHTVDLDDDIEIDGATFRRRFDDPSQREGLRIFLASVADWIEGRLTRQTVLTVYGA